MGCAVATEASLTDELAAIFASARGLLPSDASVSSTLAMLADAAQATFPGSIGAGATVIGPDGRKRSTGSTSEMVEQADSLQYFLNEGPCLTAWASGEPVRIDDMLRERRWPRWTASMQRLPVRSVISVPMLKGGEAFGALKLYAGMPAAYDASTQAVFTKFAELAADLLGTVRPDADAWQMSQELRDALHKRDTVTTAKGMLMERLRLTDNEAMDVLQTEARAENRSVHDVAAQIVADATDKGD